MKCYCRIKMGAEAPQVYQGYAGRKRTKKQPKLLFVFCFFGHMHY